MQQNAESMLDTPRPRRSYFSVSFAIRRFQQTANRLNEEVLVHFGISRNTKYRVELFEQFHGLLKNFISAADVGCLRKGSDVLKAYVRSVTIDAHVWHMFEETQERMQVVPTKPRMEDFAGVTVRTWSTFGPCLPLVCGTEPLYKASLKISLEIAVSSANIALGRVNMQYSFAVRSASLYEFQFLSVKLTTNIV